MVLTRSICAKASMSIEEAAARRGGVYLLLDEDQAVIALLATLMLKRHQFELPRTFQFREPCLLDKLNSIGFEEFRAPLGAFLLARKRVPKNVLSQMYVMGPVGFEPTTKRL